MSVMRKVVELIHSKGTIKILFEPNMKSARDSIVVDTPYHIQTSCSQLHLTRAEFIILAKLLEDWFKGKS